MKIQKSAITECVTLLWVFIAVAAPAEELRDAIQTFLQERVDGAKRDGAIVVGLLDEDGCHVVAHGKLANGTGHQADGDTLFQIGSITKTFTALLLQEMIARGEMKLEDRVAKYLPQAVTLPSRNGKEITLVQLATHTSGLPANPSNLGPSWAGYSPDQLYAFLSGYTLRYNPGERYHYSNLGASLLGLAITRAARTNYEALVVERICQPLGMGSTRITLAPELRERLAGPEEERSAVFFPQGGLRSSANDLLKYLSAELGLTRTPLSAVLEKSHEVPNGEESSRHNVGAWFRVADPQGRKFLLHGGDAGGYSAFAGFDKKERRGTVVLCFPADLADVGSLGAMLLQSQWAAKHRPKAISMSEGALAACIGEYERKDGSNTGTPPRMGLRREGEKLIAQAIGSRVWPMRALLPDDEGELVAESESRLCGLLSGIPIILNRDGRGQVTSVSVQLGGENFDYTKVSDQQPKAPERPKRPVAVRLHPRLLDACVGHYEFAKSGMKLTLRREGDKLVSEAWVEDDTDGPIDVFPESETQFFDNFGNKWTFRKNAQGQVTSVILHGSNFADCEGRKVSDQVPQIER